MISIQFTGAPDGDDGPFELTNNEMWSRFQAWAVERGYPRLKELARDGSTEDTQDLAFELRRIDKVPRVVRLVAEELLHYVGAGDPEETVSVVS